MSESSILRFSQFGRNCVSASSRIITRCSSYARLVLSADHSASDDLDVITRLDSVARRAARALRLADIAASVAELQVASGDFRVIVKEFSAASVALRKEATTLRAERLTAAVSSLTGTISSLKALEAAVKGDQDQDVVLAISRLVANAQSLRSQLERPT